MNEQSKLTSETTIPRKKKTSIVSQLSFLFLSLAVINLVVTWIFSGANQMRLISEKANLAGSSTGYEILRRVKPVFTQRRGSSNTKNKVMPTGAIATALKTVPGGAEMVINTFEIFSGDCERLASFPEKNDKPVPPEITHNILKALQLRDLNHQPFMGVPDISDYSIRLFIPLTDRTENDLVMVSRISLDSIPADLQSLIRLIAATILVLLIIQAIIGFLIYRILIKPIQTVSRAAVQLGNGEFLSIPIPQRMNDEIFDLIEAFNQMSNDLQAKDATIREQITELTEKNETLDFELEIAERIQKSILPDKALGDAKAICVAYEPLNRVSGDFFDVHHFPDNSIGILMADASGHGVPAAFLTILMKVFFTSSIHTSRDAADLMLQINAQVSRYLEDSGFYLTAFYIRIFPDLTAEYCNCGHPAPFVIHNDESIGHLRGDNNVIGLMADIDSFQAEHFNFHNGDKIILYTDGLTELKNEQGDFMSETELLQIIVSNREKNAQEIQKEILQFAQKFQGNKKRADDLTSIIIDPEAFFTTKTLTASETKTEIPASKDAGGTQVTDLLEQIISRRKAPSYYALLINEYAKQGDMKRAEATSNVALKQYPQSTTISRIVGKLFPRKT